MTAYYYDTVTKTSAPVNPPKPSLLSRARTAVKENGVLSTLTSATKKSISYAKENPGDLFLGTMAGILVSIDGSIDDIEEATEAQTALEYHQYRG